MDIDDRPTLEEQITISKLTDRECMELIMPHGWRKPDFWLHNNIHWLWSIIHWNWFDVCNEQPMLREKKIKRTITEVATWIVVVSAIIALYILSGFL